MRKKYVVAVSAMALSMGLLAGCGAPKTEDFVDKMMSTQEDSYAADFDMDIDLSANVGMDVDLSLSGSGSMECDVTDKNAPQTHVTMDLKYSAMGSSDKVSTEVYTVSEDDQLVAYTYDSESDSWTKMASEVAENPLDEKTIGEIKDAVADVLKTGEVEKKPVDVNGEACWVLKLNTNADAFADVYEIVVKAVGEDAEEAMEDAGVDKEMIETYLGFFNLDMTYYCSKKDGHLVKTEVDMSGSDTQGLVDQVNDDFGSMLSMLGVDMSTVTLDVNKLSFTCEFTEWGNVEVEVPQKVVDEAVDPYAGLSTAPDLDVDFADDEDLDVNTDDALVTDDTDDTDADSDDSDSEASVTANADGTFSLYDWDDNYLCDVNMLDGYELDENWSEPTYLSFEGADWESYTVCCDYKTGWDEVVANGEIQKEDDGDYYVLTEEEDADGDIEMKMVLDLGIEKDGNPVYAAVDGYLNDDQTDFKYASYYISYPYDDEDHWVSINLHMDGVEDWGADDFKSFYEEVMR